MNSKNTYYEREKEKVKEYVRNRYHSVNNNVKAREYYENNKERLSE